MQAKQGQLCLWAVQPNWKRWWIVVNGQTLQHTQITDSDLKYIQSANVKSKNNVITF